MINLLPRVERRRVRRLYKERIISLYLLGFLALIVVYIVMLLPSQFIFLSKKDTAESVLNIAKSQPISGEARKMETTIRETNYKIKLLQSSGPLLSVSGLVEKLLETKGAGVSFTNISYRDGESVVLRGEASRRENLSSFIETLEQDAQFTEINSPIANLINSRDINFSVVMKISDTNE
jgi:hypothetical protein